MSKTPDLPRELRSFTKIFEKLEYYHEAAEVWNDFLDLFVKQFSFDDCEELNKNIQKRYKQEERYVFWELIQETIRIMHEELKDDKDWYDMFGKFYEAMGYIYKRKGFAQYFTPSDVVDLMTEINGDKQELTGKGMFVGDPACGSGRMLISFQAHFPGNYLVGQDIDIVCCKMTILNMVLHGAKGEVVWGDSLDPEDFRRGWRITPYVTGIPHVYEIDKSESFTYQMWQEKKARLLEKEIVKQSQIAAEKAKQPVQLELNFL